MGPNINVELSEFRKNHTPNAAHITGHQKINDEQYRNHIVIDTDCSKGDAGVRAAAALGEHALKYTSVTGSLILENYWEKI